MPSDREHRLARQGEILRILKDGAKVSSQEQMVELLREKGVESTQSSVSRDMRELGVYRYGKFYALPQKVNFDVNHAQAELGARVSLFLQEIRSAGAHLLVLITQPGTAQPLALSIERMRWTEVIGTIAGDDTIFVATPGMIEQRRVAGRLKKLLSER
jgi:transcriptional regulator of arginine metabolism